MHRDVLEAHASQAPLNCLADAGRHALAVPGKMLRGRLLLEACRAVAGDAEHVMYAAAGAELGHLASLVHDDIIDGDETRRGQESVWRKFGTDVAIVSGDLLIFEAYYCLARCREHVPGDLIAWALEVTSQACVEMCLGQVAEMGLIGNCDATADQYWAVARGKTASLFRAASESGAILGGGSAEQVRAMRGFGERLGLAFQVVDDVLAYTGTGSRLGKPLASDVRNRRVTLPVLYALQDASPADAATIRAIFQSGPAGVRSDDRDRAEHQIVRRILERAGALARAQEDVTRLRGQALRCTLALPPSPARDALARTSLEALQRNS
jgi:geranylgeranyl pyrophosphate synthase